MLALDRHRRAFTGKVLVGYSESMRKKLTQTEPLTQLALLLAPYGIKTVNVGSGKVATFLEQRYGEMANVDRLFLSNLEKISSARVAVIGVPNDNGAGSDRGSKKGPMGIRTEWMKSPEHYEKWEKRGIIDVGDVLDHPLLTHDSLLQEWVIKQVRSDRWGERGDLADRLDLPVSVLSILHRVLQCIYTLNPTCRVLMLGGDHSKSLVPVEVLCSLLPKDSVGILQFDAHTDLLEQRDGLKHSYATWSWYANEMVGRSGRLVQVGIRASGKPKEYWEQELDVRQYWAEKIEKGVYEELITGIIKHFKDCGVKHLYLSNDIDALDPRYAHATGTPEPKGITPDFEMALIHQLGKEFAIVGSDLMEVAPPLLWEAKGEPERTLKVAAALCEAQVAAMQLCDSSD